MAQENEDELTPTADPTELAAEEDGEEEDEDLPSQMGHRRYVYAAFFVFAIALAYVLSKATMAAWHSLSQWSSKFGDPREDWATPLSALAAGAVIFLAYRRNDVRTLADEVALELSKVEWPTREKVQRSTFIVVGATLVSSAIFWIYDIIANEGVSFVTSSKYPVLFGLIAGGLIYVLRALGARYLAGTKA